MGAGCCVHAGTNLALDHSGQAGVAVERICHEQHGKKRNQQYGKNFMAHDFRFSVVAIGYIEVAENIKYSG